MLRANGWPMRSMMRERALRTQSRPTAPANIDSALRLPPPQRCQSAVTLRQQQPEVSSARATGTTHFVPCDFHIDDTVKWNWGNGTGIGKIIEQFTSEVTRMINGTRVERDASEDAPAYLFEQGDGQHVLKSSTGLT